MSVAQALAIAAAALVMAGDPWSMRLAQADIALSELAVRAELIAARAQSEPTGCFRTIPDSRCRKRGPAVL